MDPEYRKYYPELYQRHWWWRAREEAIVNQLRRLLLPHTNQSILDIGCGNGLFFGRLQQFGSVEGIEPADEFIDPNGPYFSDIFRVPFDHSFNPNRKYSLILMLDVLEHMDEPKEALCHCLRLLQPSGVVLITVPAFPVLWTNHDRLNRHRTRYTKASFRRLAAEAGLQIRLLRYLFYWMFPAKLACRMKESFFSREASVPQIPHPCINEFLYWVSRFEDSLLHAVPALRLHDKACNK